MLRTGASFSFNLMKINRPNFEGAPHRRAIFEDITMIKTQKVELSHAGAQFLSNYEVSKTEILRMSRAGAQKIHESGARFFYRSKVHIKRRFFQDVSSESAI